MSIFSEGIDRYNNSDRWVISMDEVPSGSLVNSDRSTPNIKAYSHDGLTYLYIPGMTLNPKEILKSMGGDKA
jgi:hypothetical protein